MVKTKLNTQFNRVIAFALSIYCVASFAQQKATFYCADSTVRKGDMILMHNDTVFVEVQEGDSAKVEKHIHKSFFTKVLFDTGDTLDLSLTDYRPPAEQVDTVSTLPATATDNLSEKDNVVNAGLTQPVESTPVSQHVGKDTLVALKPVPVTLVAPSKPSLTQTFPLHNRSTSPGRTPAATIVLRATFAALALAGGGAAIYFNTKAKDYFAKADEYYSEYQESSNSAETADLRTKVEQWDNRGKRYITYRNMGLIGGGGCVCVTILFFIF